MHWFVYNRYIYRYIHSSHGKLQLHSFLTSFQVICFLNFRSLTLQHICSDDLLDWRLSFTTLPGAVDLRRILITQHTTNQETKVNKINRKNKFRHSCGVQRLHFNGVVCPERPTKYIAKVACTMYIGTYNTPTIFKQHLRGKPHLVIYALVQIRHFHFIFMLWTVLSNMCTLSYTILVQSHIYFAHIPSIDRIFHCFLDITIHTYLHRNISFHFCWACLCCVLQLQTKTFIRNREKHFQINFK